MNREQACNEETLVLYHYGELTADDRKALESHLDICSNCRASLDDLQASLAAVPQPQLRLSDAQKVQFSEQVKERTRRSTRYLPVWGGALAGGALLVTILLLSPVDQRVSVPTADLEVMERIELLQELDLLEDFDLLQEMEQLG